MIASEYGLAATVTAVFINIIMAGLLFYTADKIIRFLGEAGTVAISKVTSLLLAAIAVMMIRKGIEMFLRGSGG